MNASELQRYSSDIRDKIILAVGFSACKKITRRKRVHAIRAEQIMVNNVKSLSKKSTYRELQDLLINMPRLKAFPVVDDPATKVLLGSINRSVLLRMLDAKVGEDARCSEALRRAQIELQVIGVGDCVEEITRFTVVPVYLKDRRGSALIGDENELNALHLSKKKNKGSKSAVRNQNLAETVSDSKTANADPQISTPEKKVIEATVTSPTTPQNEMSDKYLRPDTNRNEINEESGHRRTRLISSHSAQEMYSTIGDMLRSITNSFHRNRSLKKHRKDGDLYGEERRGWEQDQLNSCLEIDPRTIDPAPFQLVESTSLYKVHSLFSLLGIRRAYVTKCGVLVGVVALREVRTAIERAHSGDLSQSIPRASISANAGAKVVSHIGDVETGLEEGPDDSETDDEDCILPRVEVEESNTTAENFNDKLPFLKSGSFSYADSSDGADENDDQRTRHSSNASYLSDEHPTLIGLVPEGLDEFLAKCSKDPSKQIQIVPAIQTDGDSATASCSPKTGDRHVYIVEPDKDGTERGRGRCASNGSKAAAMSDKFMLNSLPKYLEIMPTLLENNLDTMGNGSGLGGDPASKVFLVKTDGGVINVGDHMQNNRAAPSNGTWLNSNDHYSTRFRSERLVRDSFRKWARRRRSLQPTKPDRALASQIFAKNVTEAHQDLETENAKQPIRPTVKSSQVSRAKFSSSLTDLVSMVGDPGSSKNAQK